MGMAMNRFGIVLFSMLVVQLCAFSSSAEALNGCLATGINGGCVSCAGDSCRLTGPSGSGSQTITLDGGVNRVSCTSDGCTPIGNYSGQGCIAQRAACFNCSSSGCRLTNISAQSVMNGAFSGFNLQDLLRLGNVNSLVDFRGISNNNGQLDSLLNSLRGLSDGDLSALLNGNSWLRNLLRDQRSNIDQNLFNRISGLPNLTFDIGSIFPGGIFSGRNPNGPSQTTIRHYDDSEEKKLVAGAVIDRMYGDPEQIDPLKQYDGLPLSSISLGNSTLLFDPKGTDTKLSYPELAASGDHEGEHASGNFAKSTSDGSLRPSLAAMELGGDREVLKSTLGAFQPISVIQKRYTESEDERDTFLDRYESALGVAKTTLAFLDPTVAAALHQVEEQAAVNATNSLLKQATWSLDQMANPENEFIHLDVNEKLQACLEGEDVGKDGRVAFGSKCTQAVAQGGCGVSFTQPNSFSACQCCAELSDAVNSTTEEGETGQFGLKSAGGKSEPGYSLVDRVFYGTRRGSTGGEARQAVEDVVRMFRNIYGDIQVIADEDSAKSTSEEKAIKQTYVLPLYSTAQIIKHLRDGIPLPSDCRDGTCRESRQIVEHGICPSVIKMMASYQSEDKSTANEKLLVEAALGGTPITARMYEAMLQLAGERFEELGEDWTPKKDEGNGLFVQWLNNFCDASAYVALMRLHTKIQAALYDHMQNNSYATSREKKMAFDLIDRVSKRAVLAKAGVGEEKNQLHATIEDLLGIAAGENRREMSTAIQLTQSSQRPTFSGLGR